MKIKRNCPKTIGEYVYSIAIKSIGKFYIGKSGWTPNYRWNKSSYKGTALEPYLEEWDSMEKTVLIDGLTKQQALQYEDAFIKALKINNLCINKMFRKKNPIQKNN